MRRKSVTAYINALLEDLVLNEVFVDRQLAYLIQQNSDYGTKLGAIREFNALRGRVQKKLDLNIVNEKLEVAKERARALGAQHLKKKSENRMNDPETRSGDNIILDAEFVVTNEKQAEEEISKNE